VGGAAGVAIGLTVGVSLPLPSFPFLHFLALVVTAFTFRPPGIPFILEGVPGVPGKLVFEASLILVFPLFFDDFLVSLASFCFSISASSGNGSVPFMSHLHSK